MLVPTEAARRPETTPSRRVDVVIVGGSFAGLAAAMTLGRSLRRVLVVDAGQPANRFAPAAHNLITEDGTAPGELLARARTQCRAYPTLTFHDGHATTLRGTDGAFVVTLDEQRKVEAGKVCFATGLRDLLLDLPGYADCWGSSVIHCPYCHGYEYAHRPTGILANGQEAAAFVSLIRNWTSDLTLFTNGPASGVDVDHVRPLARVVETPLRALAHNDGRLTSVQLQDGTALPLDALYHRPPFEQACPLPAAMGCAVTADGHVVVDDTQQTSVPGLFAAGDCTTPFRSVPIATAAGSLAGVMVNHALLAEGRYAA